MDTLIMNEAISRKYALFQAAEFGAIGLIHYLLGKGLDINDQDEGGDTLLHHAARRGDIALVTYLLNYDASVFIFNKKGRTALLEAYANHYGEAVKKITATVIRRNSVKLLFQAYGRKRIESKEQQKTTQFINDCKKHIRKAYLNRNVFSQLLAKHNERAVALIEALDRCNSVKEARELIRNQCDLFRKGTSARLIPTNLIARRWSVEIKNKPSHVDKSSFYRMLKTLPARAAPVTVRDQRQERSLRSQVSTTSTGGFSKS